MKKLHKEDHLLLACDEAWLLYNELILYKVDKLLKLKTTEY